MGLLRAAPPQKKAALRPSLVAVGLLLGVLLLLTLLVEWEWEELGVRARLRSPLQTVAQLPKCQASLDDCPQASQREQPPRVTFTEEGRLCERPFTWLLVQLQRARSRNRTLARPAPQIFLQTRGVPTQRPRLCSVAPWPVKVTCCGWTASSTRLWKKRSPFLSWPWEAASSESGGRKGPQRNMLKLEEHDFSRYSNELPKCCRVVNPDGWLSGSLDWLTKTCPSQGEQGLTRGTLVVGFVQAFVKMEDKFSTRHEAELHHGTVEEPRADDHPPRREDGHPVTVDVLRTDHNDDPNKPGEKDLVGSKVLNSDSEAEARAAQALVMVEYLVSYECMGAATLACFRGCMCTPGRVIATHGQHYRLSHHLVACMDPVKRRGLAAATSCLREGVWKVMVKLMALKVKCSRTCQSTKLEDLPEHKRTCQNDCKVDGACNSSKVDLTKLLSHWVGASCWHTAYAEDALRLSLREEQLKYILLLQPSPSHANAYAPQASTVELSNVEAHLCL
eukprot:SM000016S01860  [mRNA]  locus=s16:275622:279810:- [translate_table: standard]